ncbi:hypothetical protein K469DRAFT_703860 [Zopfia rhizophila CBS 207.26]|uniref:Uncharacterized protein n=1 Tax=Zopfia rhizophila CBS 207.26 TaxID=1314779 RepID=A0A6A6ECQ7_9PEZI|nr:hypothetical protein K469DRAFT_703860 [Zopfia rhizophila CBS 207.26]
MAIGAVEPGDKVALISGVEIPLILRKASLGHDLITYSYVHGIMQGECWQRYLETEDITLL